MPRGVHSRLWCSVPFSVAAELSPFSTTHSRLSASANRNRVEKTKKSLYMEFNNGAWLQSSLSDVSSLHDERSTNEPWKDPSSTSAVGPHAPTQAIDLHEFSLNDLPGEFPILPTLHFF